RAARGPSEPPRFEASADAPRQGAPRRGGPPRGRAAMEHEAGPAPRSAWEQLDLRDAARFVANQARQAQEEAWAGASLDNRQVWGAREAQSLHGAPLRSAIRALHRARALAAGLRQPQSLLHGWMLAGLAERVMEFDSDAGPLMEFACARGSPGAMPSGAAGGLRVCARKRPLLPFELEADGWDAVEVCCRESAVLCHDGKIHRSGRSLSMVHRRFPLHRVWPASATTEDVYRDEVAELLAVALGGGSATLLCMGQTGTGKTHTMCGVADCLVRDLRGRGVCVEFIEIYGRRCLDLLADRAEVLLRTDQEDRVCVSGQRRVELPDGSGLAEVLRAALALRACERTERNEASSRSHAVCTLTLAGAGALRLVDLAGSERNFETTMMTAQQHRDSAEINSSLMALKDCFRAHAALQRGDRAVLPFRRSRLTRVLRTCFVDVAHRTVVVGTVSPAAVDVIHTANTLKHLAMLSKPLADAASEVTVSVPLGTGAKAAPGGARVAEWSHADVLAWLSEAENGRFAHVVVPPGLDGARLLAAGEAGLAELFEGAMRRGRGENEGEAWTVSAHRAGRRLGRAIFAAARREVAAEARREALGGEASRRGCPAAGPTFGWLGAPSAARLAALLERAEEA
ncbi:unnamed protein product, partial [Prorocentrum cordatum]